MRLDEVNRIDAKGINELVPDRVDWIQRLIK